jgi:hypothetical protein
MKLTSVLLSSFLIAANSSAADILLAWDPPNATPLEEIPRLKYNLYYGVDGGAITNLIGVTTNRTYTITNMTPANYQIAARAISVWGKESVLGNVLTLPANMSPGAPVTLRGTFKGEFLIEIR